MTVDIRPILILNHIEKPVEDFLFTQFPIFQHYDIRVLNRVCYANDLITEPRTRYMGTVTSQYQRRS